MGAYEWAVCCNVLQYVAVFCSVWQCFSVFCSVSWWYMWMASNIQLGILHVRREVWVVSHMHGSCHTCMSRVIYEWFLQCMQVRRHMLQCIAVCCSVLQCAAVCCNVLQCLAVCCSVLQCVAVCCSVLQCIAVCCSVLQYRKSDVMLASSAPMTLHMYEWMDASQSMSR